MANKTYNEATVTYGSSEYKYNGGSHTVASCKFTIKDNQLTTVSGADAGTYSIKNNYADVLVGAITHRIYPLDMNYITHITNNEITINI
jgi:hypothetical protein